MHEGRRGLLLGFSAYGLWGVFPLYFPLLSPAGSVEILACRVVFSLIVVGTLLAATRRLRGIRTLGIKAFTRLAAAGLLIAVNWGLYIYAVDNGRVVEASLGYFINPLVTVGLGVLVLHERLRRAQWGALAVGVAAVAVVTVAYGRPPLLSLTLAASFGCYSLLKKTVGVGAPEGLLVESGVLTVPALAALTVLAARHTLTIGTHGPGHAALLASAGIVTAVPLLLFAGAAARLPLTTVGLLQYLTPVLQLAVGVGIRHEAFPPSLAAGFALIWVALIVLATDGLRHRAPAERQATPDVLVVPEPAF